MIGSVFEAGPSVARIFAFLIIWIVSHGGGTCENGRPRVNRYVYRSLLCELPKLFKIVQRRGDKGRVRPRERCDRDRAASYGVGLLGEYSGGQRLLHDPIDDVESFLEFRGGRRPCDVVLGKPKRTDEPCIAGFTVKEPGERGEELCVKVSLDH